MPKQPDQKIDLTRKGVFLIQNGIRSKIAERIRVVAAGRRDSDDVMHKEISFATSDRLIKKAFVRLSMFRPRKWGDLEIALADLGYEWPEDGSYVPLIIQALANQKPDRKFRLVQAPGWYGDAFVIPGKIFAPTKPPVRILIDRNSAAHVGEFNVGKGDLSDWIRRVAKPCTRSSRLMVSLAAALAAPFLRSLGVDSFGINWFSQSSDGKTLCLIVASSVAGLIGSNGGLLAWADTLPGMEDQIWGHRDSIVPLDDTGDEAYRTSARDTARQVAFMIGRNRPRTLSKVYEQNHALSGREFRVVLLSSSERALGKIAREAGSKRLGGEEVRLVDIPAGETGSSGVFDRRLNPAVGRSIQETTAEWVRRLKANAIRYQGHPLRALLGAYVKDPDGLSRLKRYKKKFESKFAIDAAHNAHYRIRGNFAAIYAAAMLAIDYGVLRWKKDLTYRVIAKCLRLALDNLVVTQVTKRNPENTAVAADEHEIRKSLTRMFKAANIIPIAPNAKVSQAEADRRRAAEGFIRGGEVLVHSDVVKRALPGHEDQRALRSLNLIRTERPDTATVSKKITGVQGRRRYYAFDLTFYGESVKADPAEANDP